MRATILVTVVSMLFLRNEAHSERANQGFHFAWIAGGVPYVIINGPEALHQAERRILHSQLKTAEKNAEGAISLRSLSEPPNDLVPFLFWDSRAPGEWSEITGPSDIMCEVVGFTKGDKLIMQPVTADGSGEQHEIEVAQCLYYSEEHMSLIVIKCEPVSFHHDTLNVSHPWDLEGQPARGIYSPYVACYFAGFPKYWYQVVPHSAMSSQFPEAVSKQAKKLSATFFNSASDSGYSQALLQTFRFFGGPRREQIYCLLTAYQGDKAYTGSAWIIDNEGHTYRQIGPLDTPLWKRLSGVVGITDVNRDGTHEVVLLYGNGYSGGVLIMHFSLTDPSGPPEGFEVDFEAPLGTMFD